MDYPSYGLSRLWIIQALAVQVTMRSASHDLSPPPARS